MSSWTLHKNIGCIFFFYHLHHSLIVPKSKQIEYNDTKSLKYLLFNTRYMYALLSFNMAEDLDTTWVWSTHITD